MLSGRNESWPPYIYHQGTRQWYIYLEGDILTITTYSTFSLTLSSAMTTHRLATHWGCLRVAAQCPLQNEASPQLRVALLGLSCTLPSSGPAATMRYWICNRIEVKLNCMLTTELKSVCNFPECFRGANAACQGKHPSSGPSRVLLAPPGSRHWIVGEVHWEEHGRVCHHHTPHSQGDTP